MDIIINGNVWQFVGSVPKRNIYKCFFPRQISGGEFVAFVDGIIDWTGKSGYQTAGMSFEEADGGTWVYQWIYTPEYIARRDAEREA